MNTEEYRKNYVKNESEKTQKQYLDTFKSKSKSRAIRVKCLDCCGFQPSEAADCKATSCPLYEINPYRLARLKRNRTHGVLQNDDAKTSTKSKEN